MDPGQDSPAPMLRACSHAAGSARERTARKLGWPKQNAARSGGSNTEP